VADTADLLDREPSLAQHFAGVPPGWLTPIEQEPLPQGPLDEVLATIRWPPAVLGCILITELVMLPHSAEQEAPYHEREIEIWATSHPERQDARLAIGVTRSGLHASCLRVRGDDELIVDPDLADAVGVLGRLGEQVLVNLVDRLFETFR
jgi:hypothetical protein